MTFNPDPVRKWRNKSFDESKLTGLSRREKSALETDRDLAKPVEQLVCDVHEETHDPNRTEIQNVAGAQKRVASLMAQVALSNDRVASRMLYLTIAIAVMTLVILIYTILMWQQNNKPNQAVNSTTTRVTPPAMQVPNGSVRAYVQNGLPAPPWLREPSAHPEPVGRLAGESAGVLGGGPLEALELACQAGFGC